MSQWLTTATLVVEPSTFKTKDRMMRYSGSLVLSPTVAQPPTGVALTNTLLLVTTIPHGFKQILTLSMQKSFLMDV